MFNIPHSTYYNWEASHLYNRKPDASNKHDKRNAEICMAIMAIVRALSFVPGSRTLAMMIRRNYPELKGVGRKIIAVLMKYMHLQAYLPQRDAYKHQACHDHPLTAPDNLVGQDFLKGIRQVILTDITYLYYGKDRSTFYVCMFKDAFTTEILGVACSLHMNVSLIKAAYDDMMANHKSEFQAVMKGAKVYIHSDQGSQYLSTTFKQLLHEDNFIQSVSGRGNSQDNSPMESHFAQLKTQLLSVVALARNFTDASAMVLNHTRQFNMAVPRTCLAGLTPVEFYQYCVTGIYPCSQYYGICAEQLSSSSDLIEWRKRYAEEQAAKRRAQYAGTRKRNETILTDPAKVFDMDRKTVEKEIRKTQQEINEETEYKNLCLIILDKIDAAKIWFEGLETDEKANFKDKKAWQTAPQTAYIYDMRGMF